MKKFLIFMLLVMASFIFTSCSWFDVSPNAQKVGTGYIQNDNGLLVVEIDGKKYAPKHIYTNTSTRDGKTKMEPIIGMEVTVFYQEGYANAQFIAGARTEEYLEEYFTKNYTFAVVCLVIILALVIPLFFVYND